MTHYSQHQFLRGQIAHFTQMVETETDPILMRPMYKNRLRTLQAELAAMPDDQPEAKVALYFWGKPTVGSLGIEAEFLANVLGHFKSMVATDYANSYFGGVSERGAVPNPMETKLYLTALPRGSFGVELTKLTEDNLFDNNQMGETLGHIIALVEAATTSDAIFLKEAESAAGRTIKALGEMLAVVSKAEGGFALESGTKRLEVSESRVKEAAHRTAYKDEEVNQMQIDGIISGFLKHSKKLEIVDNELKKYAVKVPKEFLEAETIAKIRATEDERCLVKVEENKVIFTSGLERKQYTLLEVPEILA